MNRGAVSRRLAAIFIADVVGFSRQMERDDAGAFARLREIRERVVDPKIAEHGGRVVKTAGDGMLLEFGSADAALRCGIDVQRAMSADNQSKAPDERIEFRIGINSVTSSLMARTSRTRGRQQGRCHDQASRCRKRYAVVESPV